MIRDGHAVCVPERVKRGSKNAENTTDRGVAARWDHVFWNRYFELELTDLRRVLFAGLC